MAYISDIDDSGPVGSDDRRLGDNEIKQLKTDVYQSFPNVSGQVSKTHTQLNDTTEASAIETISASWTFTQDITFGGSITVESDIDVGDNTASNFERLLCQNNLAIATFGISAGGSGTMTMFDSSGLNPKAAVQADHGGEARLYHDGTNKAQTTSTGFNVTGEMQCNTIDCNGNADINGVLTVNSITNRSDGAYPYFDDSALSSGKITLQSGGSVPGAGTGANGDIYLIY